MWAGRSCGPPSTSTCHGRRPNARRPATWTWARPAWRSLHPQPRRSPNPTSHKLVRRSMDSVRHRLAVDDRVPTGDVVLYRARSIGAAPLEPVVSHRYSRGRTDAALRARPSGIAHPRRCQDAGHHPADGGWRFVGRAQGARNRRTTAGIKRSRHRQNVLATHSPTPSQATTPGSPTPRSMTTKPRQPPSGCRAARLGGSRCAASSSNASCRTTAPLNGYHAWCDACAELHIRHKRTRPYRPQTDGKIARFHRTMARKWAFARPYPNELGRRSACPA